MESNKNPGLKKFLNLERIQFAALIFLLVLIPSFFLTSNFVTFQFAKAFLLSVGITCAFSIFLIGIIKKGQLTLIKSPVFIGLGAVVLAYVLSAVFSGTFYKTFIGYGFESTTATFVILMALLTILFAHTFTDAKKIFLAYLAFFAVSFAMGLFHISRLWFGSDFLSLGIFSTLVSNIVGSWSEVGVFFGISVILSLLALETLRLSRLYRFILWAVLIVSFAMVFVVNFSMVWYVLATVVILFFVYYSSSSGLFTNKVFVSNDGTNEQGVRQQETPRRRIAFKSLFVAIAIIVCLLPVTRDLSQGLSVRLGIENVEVRPSWQSTRDVLVSTLSEQPIIGAGPNRFSVQWQLFRPDVNLGNFWNSTFSLGVGYIPTSIIETGIVGILAWLGFVVSFLYVGFRGLFARGIDLYTRYALVSSFTVSLFLWVIMFIYIPSAPLIGLTFAFTGLFIASSVSARISRQKTFEFMKYEKLSFVVVMALVFVLICVVGLGYILFETQRSSIYFQKGISIINSGQDVDAGENYLARAAELSGHDIYFQSLTELNILRIQAVMANAIGREEVTETEQQNFQTALSRAIEFSLLAVKADPKNFQNHALVGKVYETIVPVKIEKTYENSLKGYRAALALSPRNPALYLDLARLDVTNGDLDGAQINVQKSLELKPNFVDAIFLQSQIDVARGNLPLAIKSVEKIVALTPNDPLGYFRLGILKYENKDYTGAIQSLEQSVVRVPVYANARYFLGLSYAAAGRTSDALVQFREVQKTNKENAELASIISNLEAGRSPFSSASSSVSDVEDIEELPVEENY